MRAAREWDSEALSSQSDNEVDLSHFAPIIDTAVSFSDVQANSFSLLWIVPHLYTVYCVYSPLAPCLPPGGRGWVHVYTWPGRGAVRSCSRVQPRHPRALDSGQAGGWCYIISWRMATEAFHEFA